MSRNYQLFCDATNDLPAEVIERLDVHIIPMEVVLDDICFQYDMYEKELSCKEFYKQLREGKLSSTSQITPVVYETLFRPVLEEGMDIFYLCFTSGMSGTYQASLVARELLLEEFPDRKILCVDSLCASVGEGMLLYHVAHQRQKGMSLEQLEAWTLEHRLETAHWFTVEDLFHLNRGGRLSTVEALLGTALKIKPIISVNQEGKLYVAAKVRGTKKSMEFLVNKYVEEAGHLPKQTVLVGHGDNLDQAKALEQILRQRDLVEDVIITNIGPVIGTHTGPGMLALVFMRKL
jgi:DegV family protein with EDD domain